MIAFDNAGNPNAGATPEGLAAFEIAVAEFQRYATDPLSALDRALALAPALAMAHALRAYLHLLGTEPGGVPEARAALDAAQALPAGERERGHLAAIAYLLDGRWQAAGLVLEDVSIAWPRDAIALQVGHTVDFMRGDSRMLRDRIVRALPAWSRDMPGYHAVLGMHAFGLEETGHYAAAERAGRAAVLIEPRDAWAQHAVAHVMEMQGRVRDGIAWMTENPAAWSADNALAVHNWWHVALFHLDLGETGRVLELFDGPVAGGRSALMLDLVDASALLWRLHLGGADLEGRWEAVADRWRQAGAPGRYASTSMRRWPTRAPAGRRRCAKSRPHRMTRRRATTTTRVSRAMSAGPRSRRSRRSPPAATPRPCVCCARSATSRRASAVATPSATCST